MDSTHFEYKITSCPHDFDPYRAEVTCGEVLRRSFILDTSSTSVSLPEQTIGHHTDPIALYILNEYIQMIHLYNGAGSVAVFGTSNFSLNCPGIFKLMTSRFGVDNYSSIISEIEAEIISLNSRGRGVFQVKILMIRTKVSKFDKDSEKLVTDIYGRYLTIDRRHYHVSTECVVCMKPYDGESVVAILPCGHDFHGLCIYKWSQIKQKCPLCRFRFSTSSPFSFYLHF